ncbi:MAG: ribonuclease III [candidate division KSB1 bacterium]
MLKWWRKVFFRKGHTGGEQFVRSASEFARIIGYRFRRRALLVQALKHRSFLPQVNEERACSNERMELLGDAVLGIVVTDHLYRRYPDKEEGEITAIKSLLVSRKILTRIARNLDLGKFVLMSDSEDHAGGRTRPSILADSFEAVIGAIYLDGGLEKARGFIERTLMHDMEAIVSEEQHRNFKSLLLELSQSRNMGTPYYAVLTEEGPDHEKLFTVEVKIQNRPMGVGVGHSKKRAEQQAAQNALAQLVTM